MSIIKRLKDAFRIVLLVFILGFVLSGCGASADLERTNPKKLAKKEAEDIFEYIKAEDIDSLVALFSSDVQKSHDLKKEWESFFEELDGKAVSYEGISFPGEGMGVDKKGNIYDSHLSINYNNVKTDNGTTYTEFGYFQTRIDTAHPDREGINIFTFQIVDKEGNKGEFITVGEYIEYQPHETSYSPKMLIARTYQSEILKDTLEKIEMEKPDSKELLNNIE